MEHCFNVRDWMEWSCPTWPTPALCKHLPEEILNHPLDTKDMMHRVKIFAATVALHQAFVDFRPEVPESDSKRFRSMLDHANNTFDLTDTMTSLRELRHLCDEARHYFCAHTFWYLAGDWPPDPAVDATDYGRDLLRARRRTVVEIVPDPAEDPHWVKVKVSHMPSTFVAADMVLGWVPRTWLKPTMTPTMCQDQ